MHSLLFHLTHSITDNTRTNTHTPAHTHSGFVVHRGRTIPTLASMQEPLPAARSRQSKERTSMDTKNDDRGKYERPICHTAKRQNMVILPKSLFEFYCFSLLLVVCLIDLFFVRFISNAWNCNFWSPIGTTGRNEMVRSYCACSAIWISSAAIGKKEQQIEKEPFFWKKCIFPPLERVPLLIKFWLWELVLMGSMGVPEIYALAHIEGPPKLSIQLY